MRGRTIVVLIAAACAAGCATLDDFNRTGVVWSDSAVCSARFDAARRKDVHLWRATGAEMAKRKLTEQQCLVFAENQRKVGEAIGTVVGVVAVSALVVGAAKYGGPGSADPRPSTTLVIDYEWDWDEFLQGSTRVWACRGVQTGQFALESSCVGRPKTDLRWPGLWLY